MKNLVFLLVLLSASSQAYSEEIRYIRDQLYVPLRSGQTMQHRIVHKGLVSGTKVTVTEVNEDQSYSFVRTGKGIEGWIQTQYLSPDPAGRDLLKIANTTINKLTKQKNTLEQQLNTLKAKDQQAQSKLSSLSKNNTQINDELEKIKSISANSLQINEDNQRLLEQNQMLKNELEVLSTDNQRLNDNHENDAFLNGAFAVLIGVMITLVVPRVWPKKSTDWA